MNARDRRKARRALSRRLGIDIPPGHEVALDLAEVRYESGSAPGMGATWPVAAVYTIAVVPSPDAP